MALATGQPAGTAGITNNNADNDFNCSYSNGSYRMKKRKIILLGNAYSTGSLYRHSNRGITYMSSNGRKMKRSYIEQASAQYKDAPLEEELNLEIHLHFGDKKIRDWDNFHKISMDALTGIVWVDDSQIQRATVEKHYDKENPRIEITITKYK